MVRPVGREEGEDVARRGGWRRCGQAGRRGRGSDDVVLTSDAEEINGQVCVKCSIYMYIVTQTDKHLYDD